MENVNIIRIENDGSCQYPSLLTVDILPPATIDLFMVQFEEKDGVLRNHSLRNATWTSASAENACIALPTFNPLHIIDTTPLIRDFQSFHWLPPFLFVPVRFILGDVTEVHKSHISRILL